MTFLVAFDGSDLAAAALTRAQEFAASTDDRVVALTAVPDQNASYARDHGWIGDDEVFDTDTIAERLRARVVENAPAAVFRYELVGRRAPPGTVATAIRNAARREEASTVFVGSENAGRLVSAVTSVGSTVAADRAYDVVIVRSA
jgi:nucleotide-binding universal stress UspA family protein